MRVKLLPANRNLLFGIAKQRVGSWKKMAVYLNTSTRMLSDWRKGDYTLPGLLFKKLVKLAEKAEEYFDPIYLNNYWHIKEAAKKGAYARMMLHGNLGTPEGRRLGGVRSATKRQKLGIGYNKIKVTKNIRESVDLAELLGILVGDGHLSEYQVVITTSKITDLEHALFIKGLLIKLFKLVPTFKEREGENVVMVRVSSKHLVGILNKYGMPIGNKIKEGLTIPKWVKDQKRFQKAFIRGLFDTDGCVYLDRHKTTKKVYFHYGWTITSLSDTLIKDIIEVLRNLNFSPTHAESQNSVYLRKGPEIQRYFQEIKTHNPKHEKRYSYGRVPKWS